MTLTGVGDVVLEEVQSLHVLSATATPATAKIVAPFMLSFEVYTEISEKRMFRALAKELCLQSEG